MIIELIGGPLDGELYEVEGDVAPTSLDFTDTTRKAGSPKILYGPVRHYYDVRDGVGYFVKSEHVEETS